MDMMGMTDNENPIGLLPFLNPGFGNYFFLFLNYFYQLIVFIKTLKNIQGIGAFGKRRKRSTNDPDIGPDKLAGGERYVLYSVFHYIMQFFNIIIYCNISEVRN